MVDREGNMYHLLVTAQAEAWKKPFYEYDRSRFLEYTNDKTAKTFEVLTDELIAILLTLPCLLAYEGTEEDVRVGRLRTIKERGRSILIEFDVNPDIPPIPFKSIQPIAPLLDIRAWEMSRTHWAIKDEDLLQRLRDEGLIQCDDSEPVRVRADQLPDAATPSLSVSTVGGFIDKVLQMTNGNKEVFYRGHSNATKYKLQPSLFRKDEHGNYLYLDNEHTLYRELLVSNSIDFHGDNYTLDRLVRMQHYSLPTRLLDITSNPLMALYFACKSNIGRRLNGRYVDEEIGEVIVFALERDKVKYFDSDTASCIANLARMPKTDKDAIDHSIEDISVFNAQLPIQRLIHFVKEEKSFFEPHIQREHLRTVLCVKGKRSNDRISSQSGAFLLFGLDAVLDEKGTPDIGVTRIGVSADGHFKFLHLWPPQNPPLDSIVTA
jgi:hypothetical protein